MFDFALGRLRDSKHSNTGSADADDGVVIPQQGFLSKKEFSLPTYQNFKHPSAQSPSTATLTRIDILKTIEDNYTKARLILYETAHLNRAWFAVIQRGRVKLCNEARALDQALYEATQELTPASTDGRDADNRAVQSPRFKDALAEGTKTLRRLEKKLRDDVIDELMAGLIDKKDVDHAQLRLLVDKIQTEVSCVCSAVMRQSRTEKDLAGLGEWVQVK